MTALESTSVHQNISAVPYLPDLRAKGAVVKVDHASRQLWVAALIENIGLGSATGPFEIDLAVTLRRGDSVTSHVINFVVPSTVRLSGTPVLQQALARAPVGNPTAFQTQYVSQQMQLPLHYRDEHPSATYEIEFIVDAEGQITESNESNNHFFAKWWTTSPAASERSTPFVTESVRFSASDE